MKKIIIIASIFLMSTFALSFEVLGIKSGMTKSEIEAKGFKVDSSYGYYSIHDLKHPLLNKMYLTFDDKGKLYDVQLYTVPKKNDVIWDAAVISILEEKYPKIKVYPNEREGYFYFNLTDENIMLNYINSVKKGVLSKTTKW